VYSREKVVTLPSLRRSQNDRIVMLKSLGELYTLGLSINWLQLNQRSDGTFVYLRILGRNNDIGLRRKTPSFTPTSQPIPTAQEISYKEQETRKQPI
jgi:acyl transferase domain-containing protein